MAAPPSLAGGVNLTVALDLAAVTPVIAGAPGVVAGVALSEGADASPVPAVLVAVTVKVYAVPFVSPLTVMGLTVPVAVFPPGMDVTV